MIRDPTWPARYDAPRDDVGIATRGSLFMHTIELLAEACSALERLGYQVRTEPLDGGDGGVCEFAGRKWLFLDVVMTPAEQLQAVLEVLRGEFYIDRIKMSTALSGLVRFRTAAA